MTPGVAGALWNRQDDEAIARVKRRTV